MIKVSSVSAESTDSDNPAKRRLLEAAIEEFAEHGYQRATVREICKRANANVNAVKYYFGDKHNLYLEALRHAHGEIHAAMMDSPPDPGDPPAQLRWFVLNMMRTLLSRQGRDTHHMLIMHEFATPTDGTEAIAKQFIQPRFELLLGTLQQLAPHVPVEKLRLLGYSVIGQCIHYKLAMPVVKVLTPAHELQGYTAEHLAEHVLDVTYAALAALKLTTDEAPSGKT